ncbi:hypothetical protein C2S52_006944 [Perilla frutescens var. hirtella]|nr:hypothetical protein C2S52_006944 [Perilla frutescens var. hirtella]
MDVELRKRDVLIMVRKMMSDSATVFAIVLQYFINHRRLTSNESRPPIREHYSLKHKIPKQVEHLHEIIAVDDVTCINNLRMSRDAFVRLCYLLQHSGGLQANRNVSIHEQVAMFLAILGHHTKNRIVKHNYKRSGRTVSKNFHAVLNSVIRLRPVLLAQPEPVTEDCSNDRWKWFKGCLGALDGTYIDVTALKENRARYRNRKGQTIVNVLAVCNQDMKFIYVLSGWEGSAADSRVLRDAVTRENGLRVPRGNYYLCDNGYTNSEGFLTPYRGVRYHLNDWGEGTSIPRNKEEFYNMKHSRARNVIERSFGLLKGRWGILRSASFYPIKVQNRIILACCLVHNFIRNVMEIDPIENEVPEFGDPHQEDYVDVIESRWKCENGFRTGYLICLEKEFLKAFPSSDLRAEPHVNSKMHVWKKCYSSLSFMLGRRGFGWNDETKMFTVENESIWKEHVKIDPFARTMRYKTWPHYHHWCEIFGKDRATGENAEDFSSADKDQLDVNNVEFEGNMNDVMPEEENDFVSVCQPASSSTGKKSKSKRKRLIDSTGEKLVELMGAFCEETKSGLSDLTKKMGVDYDLQTQRKSVYEALGVIRHLSVTDKVHVAKKLVNNSKELDLFFSLPDEAKKEMVRQLIHDDI